MFSKSLEMSLGAALSEARERRHEYLCVEHLLYALIDDQFGREILENCGADVENLRVELDEFFETELPRAPKGTDHVPQQTLGFERLMQRAVAHVHYSGKKEVDAGDILAAIFDEKNAHATYFLASEGITRLDVLNYISHGISKVVPGPASSDPDVEGELLPEEEGRARPNPLESFTVSLNARAAQGKIDPIIGREFELRRTIQVLCRRRKNNPIYVGEPGVGKTALVEGLALRIHDGNVPEVLELSLIHI